MRRAAIWAIALLVAVGLMLAGALGAFSGPGTFAVPASAHFVQASAHLGSVPTDVPLGVPVTELDPGFSGPSALIIGRIAECDPHAGGPRPTVALVQGDRLLAGQIVNRGGGFSFTVPWTTSATPAAPAGLSPADILDAIQVYTLVPSSGLTRQIVAEPLHTTYAVLSEPCQHAATP